MAGEANAAEFEGDAYLANFRAAHGYDTSDRVTGGIFQPEPEKLRPGATIYRFGDTTKDIEHDRFGRWWVASETIELLARYAVDAESLVRIVRIHLAVPPGFNAMDRMFIADVRLTLRAFGGVGGLVFEDLPAGPREPERTVKWPGGTELIGTPTDRTMKRQLFVPGLAKVPNALAYRPVRSVKQWIGAFRHGGA